MKIEIWSIGKKNESYIEKAIEEFMKRLKNYNSCELKILAPSKNKEIKDIKKEESQTILKQIQKEDILFLLDEKGKQWDNMQWANKIEEHKMKSSKKIIILIGGAYGVDKDIEDRANELISLSALVFPHQLVRLIVAEQLYRTFTIIKGEGYHHF